MNDSFDNSGYADDLLNDNFPKRSRTHFVPLILAGGLFTTLCVLILVFILSSVAKQSLFSIFISFIPIGAVIAGLVAGCGYAITARLLQYKPSTGFILFICVLQFGMFFVGRYIEFLPFHFRLKLVGAEDALPFGIYYRSMIEDSQWTSSRSNKEPYTLGKFGWVVEAVTALCFSLTSLVGPAVLAAFAYCGRCRRFMKKGLEFTFPARAVPRKIKKNDVSAQTAYQEEDQAAFEAAAGSVVRIIDFLNTDQAKDRTAVYRFLCELRDEIAPDPKAFKGVPNTIKVTLSGCNECDNYQLVVQMEVTNPNDKAALKPIEFLRFIDGNFVTRNLPASEA